MVTVIGNGNSDRTIFPMTLLLIETVYHAMHKSMILSISRLSLVFIMLVGSHSATSNFSITASEFCTNCRLRCGFDTTFFFRKKVSDRGAHVAIKTAHASVKFPPVFWIDNKNKIKTFVSCFCLHFFFTKITHQIYISFVFVRVYLLVCLPFLKCKQWFWKLQK